MAYVPNLSSVVAFQSDPTKLVATVSVVGMPAVTITGNPSISGTVNAISTNVGSVITVAQGSVGTVIIGGSIAASFTPPANQSVSGTVDIGVMPGSVAAFIKGNASMITVPQGSTAVAIVSGSIAASFTPPANQSVSGTVGSSIIGIGVKDDTYGIGLVNSPPNAIISASDNLSNNFRILSDIGQNWITTTVAPTVFNGTNWDRLRGNSSIGALVSTAQSSVITVGQGSVGVAIISGSVAVSVTPPANQSVSGTVGAAQIGAWSSSVVGSVSTYLQSSGGSVISAIQGSVATVIIGGSIAASFTPPANQSVSGTVDIGVMPGSVAAFIKGNASVITVGQGSVAVAIVSGSIAATFTPPANQSVSGTVQAEQIGTAITSLVSTVPSSVIVGASIFGLPPVNVTNTNLNVGGSVAAWLQSTNASVITVGGAAGNSSVMLLNSANAIGSVTILQGTNPLIITGSIQGATSPANQSVSGTVGASIIGTVPVVQSGTQITSLVSTIPSSVQVGVSVMGIAPVTLTANTVPASALAFLGATTSITAANSSVITVTGYPMGVLQITSNPSMTGTIQFEGSADNSSWLPITGYNQRTASLGSVTTVADDNWMFNFAGLQTFRARLSAWTAGSITGKVYLSPADARPITNYIVGNPSISGQVGASIIGQLPAGTAPLGSVATLQGTVPWIISSVYGNISGSVAAFVVGNASLITLNQGSSILSVPVGSTVVMLQAPSIVGTYAEDAAHTTADKGLFIMGVRNDAVSSITTAERDYSPMAVDEAGRSIVMPFAGQQACIISYAGSVVSGSVTLIQASVIGSRSYVTDFSLNNSGSTTTLVTIQGGDTSLLGQFIVPAGGGNNKQWQIPLRTTLSQDLAFKVSPSQSVLYATIKGYQSP